MRTVEIKLYKIGELDEDVRACVVSEHRRLKRRMGDVTEYVTERLEQELDYFGLPSDALEWSLSYCQGDGVAFYGIVDVNRLRVALGLLTDPKQTPCPDVTETMHDEIVALLGVLRRNFAEEVSLAIDGNSFSYHYSHARTMEAEGGIDPTNEDEVVLYEAFLSYIHAVSRYLETLGYSIIEDIESDESIIEECEANEYEFLEDGMLAPSFIRKE